MAGLRKCRQRRESNPMTVIYVVTTYNLAVVTLLHPEVI
jgi:hypothetical protein